MQARVYGGVIARGASIKGANSLYFDKHDRLHLASVFGREIIVMDPNNGKILERIGLDRGVDTPDVLLCAEAFPIKARGLSEN